MPTAPVPGRTRRVDVFDGLRGIAVVLVVMSHGWTLWPVDRIAANPILKALFSSGDFAVSVFFVIGFFLTTRTLLRSTDAAGGLRPSVAVLRRLIRLGGQLYFLLLVVLLVTAFDTTDTYPKTATRESVLRAASFTWNWYAHDHALVARPDLGHLWYLSVDLQAFVLVAALVYLLRRRPVWLLVTLVAIVLVCFAWRSHVYATEGWYSALTRTWARVDAPATGALAAVALPYLDRLRPWAGRIVVASLVTLLPLLYLTAPIGGYFGWAGAALDLTLAALVVGTSLATPPRAVARVVGAAPFAALGRRSLGLYLWHYPIFWFLSRHTSDWSWEARALLAIGLTLLMAEISERLIEVRVRRVLDAESWSRFDDGVLRYVLRTAWDRVRPAGRRRDRPDVHTSA